MLSKKTFRSSAMIERRATASYRSVIWVPGPIPAVVPLLPRCPRCLSFPISEGPLPNENAGLRRILSQNGYGPTFCVGCFLTSTVAAFSSLPERGRRDVALKPRTPPKRKTLSRLSCHPTATMSAQMPRCRGSIFSENGSRYTGVSQLHYGARVYTPPSPHP